MTFIEQLFGISPDRGNGSLEILWVGVLVVGVCAWAFRDTILARLAAGWRHNRR